jgi:hypothetical protein
MRKQSPRSGDRSDSGVPESPVFCLPCGRQKRRPKYFSALWSKKKAHYLKVSSACAAEHAVVYRSSAKNSAYGSVRPALQEDFHGCLVAYSHVKGGFAQKIAGVYIGAVFNKELYHTRITDSPMQGRVSHKVPFIGGNASRQHRRRKGNKVMMRSPDKSGIFGGNIRRFGRKNVQYKKNPHKE